MDAVHEGTKIPMDALRAIEEGYNVRSLSPFYLKGFIKMYAEYLGINVNDAPEEVAKYNPSSSRPAEIRAPGFDLNQWSSKIWTRRRKQQIVISVAVILVIFLSFKTVTFFTHRKPKAASSLPQNRKTISTAGHPEISKNSRVRSLPDRGIPSPGNAARSSERPKAAKVEKEDVVALENIRIGEIIGEKKAAKTIEGKTDFPKQIPPQTVYTANPSAVVPASSGKEQTPKNITLTVRSRKDSWLRVKTDGVVVFQSPLGKGAVETWVAGEQIEISGKNMHQLEFEVNGRVLGPLGRKDHHAKKIVVTKDGLSVVD